jgi:cytoskeletal protein CcmA (bactofilin family)
MNNQKGFILLAVMLVTAMTSVIVISSMRDNVIQERLTGNYQKKINARLMSEKGIFDSYQHMVNKFEQNPEQTLEELVADLNAENLNWENQTKDMGYEITFTEEQDGEYIELSSKGTRFEGRNNKVALFEIIREGGGGTASTFQSAISGCEGVTLGGSGLIDSYDSSQGNYNANNATNDAGVSTINVDSDITLSGASPISGDVLATGDINLTGSAKITGDVHANGNIRLTGTGSVGGDALARGSITVRGKIDGNAHANGNIVINGSGKTVGGDVLTRENVTLTQNRVGGVIRAGGNLNLSSYAEVLNSNNQILDVMYGGTITPNNNLPNQYKQTNLYYDGVTYANAFYNNPLFNTNPSVSEVPEVESEELDIDYDNQGAANVCDPIGIANFTDDFKVNTSPNLNLTRGGTLYSINNNEGKMVSKWQGWMGAKPPALLPSVETLPNGESVNMFKVKNFRVNNGGFEVKDADVHLMVDGNFEIGSGGTTKFKIHPGSSLTIYVTGTTVIKKAVNLREGLSDEGVPVFSIYSSYSNKNGVTIDATGKVYAAIYAPNTEAKITASGNFMGAIRSKTVTVSGAGKIHYDTQLGEISNVSTDGDGAGSTRIVFVGWRYKDSDEDDG